MDLITQDDVLAALKQYFRCKNFKLLNWELKSLNDEARLGYLGDHFLIESTVQRQGPPEQVSFFVKTFPKKKVHQDLIEAAGFFKKEVLFYQQLADQLIAILAKLQPTADGCKMPIIPRCYLAKDKFLIMENLVKLGFQPVSSDTPFSLEYFYVTVRSIARYHAASIVLEHQQGVPLSRKYPDLIYESFLNGDPDHYLAPWHAASTRAALALVPLLERYKDKPDVVKKTQEALPSLVRELMERVTAWPDTVNVFGHGDLWSNNILFLMDCNGKPSHVSLNFLSVSVKHINLVRRTLRGRS